MRRLFSRIKLEPRASVALFKNTDGPKSSTTLYDQLQGMLNEHDKQQQQESDNISTNSTNNGSTAAGNNGRKRKKNSSRSSSSTSPPSMSESTLSTSTTSVNGNLSTICSMNGSNNSSSNGSIWGHEFPSNSPEHIPQFLFHAMEYLEKQGLETQGIFRHSTSRSREEKVMKEIDELFKSGGAKLATIDFNEYSDVHLAASLIKLYLRKLKEPLLTNKLYESFLATSKMINITTTTNTTTTNATTATINSAAEIEEIENNRKCQLLQQICGLLPRANYILLKKLCLFLNNVSKKQQVNLMSPENIAIVIQPNILYLKDQDPMLTIRDISNATNVIKSLIVYAPQIFDENVVDIQTSDDNDTTTANDQTDPFVVDEDLGSYNANNTTNTPNTPNNTINTSANTNNHHNNNDTIQSGNNSPSRVYHKRQVSVKMVIDRSVDSVTIVEPLSSQTECTATTTANNNNSNSSDMTFINHAGGGTGTDVTDGADGSGDHHQPFYKGDTNTNGQKHGFGILMYNDGGIYEGYFIDDMRDGLGKMVFTDGSRYEGEFSKDLITGKGIYKYASGDLYDGHFINSIKSGRGKMKFSANQSHYDGEWNNDKREGFGKQSYPNGDVYEGEWLEDFSNGYGTFTSSGYTYVGYWRRGKFDGRGKFVLLDSKECLEGSWVDGQIEGDCSYTDAQGRKFAQLYERGELIKNEQVIDENEKKVLDLLAKLMEEPIKSHPLISSFLAQQSELINKVVDVNDIASDNEQADSQNLRNALFKILTNPQTIVVFQLLSSLVDMTIQSLNASTTTTQ